MSSNRGPLDRLALFAGGGVLVMTAGFGRSSVRDAAYRLRDRRHDLDLKLSWHLFPSLIDWAERWPVEQNNFGGGLILSATGTPVVERAVGRCLVDLNRLGRPILWGVASDRVRWHPRFMISRNGWPLGWFPHPTATYARLGVGDSAEFCPHFDPILYSADADFFISSSRLYWRDKGLFDPVTGDG